MIFRSENMDSKFFSMLQEKNYSSSRKKNQGTLYISKVKIRYFTIEIRAYHVDWSYISGVILVELFVFKVCV